MTSKTAARKRKDQPGTDPQPIDTSKAPFLPPDWPAANVEVRKVDALVPYANNSRIHTKSQVKQIAASITEFGFTIPVLIDEASNVIAGHGRILAAKLLGFAEVPCMVAKGWTEAQRRAYVITDNKLTENGGWDEGLLRVEMAAILAAGMDLKVTGFSAPEIRNLKLPDPSAKDSDEGLGAVNVGQLLGLVDITIAEPRHRVEKGETYHVGPHYLLCISVIRDHKEWAPLLMAANAVGSALFAPYPGVFVPFGEKAADHTLIMVQPDPYIAGHILDRYSEVHGEEAVRLVGQE